MPGPCVTSIQRHGHRWRFGIRAATGCPLRYCSFPTERDAAEAHVIAREELHRATRPISELLELYAEHLVRKGNRPSSRQSTNYRLQAFFEPALHLTLADLTLALLQRLYDRACEGRSADTHQGWLREAKTFLRWCVKKKWAPTNPLEDVEPIGQLSAGKPQPRIDEARRWFVVAVARAQAGDGGAIAAILALVCGMRTVEIVSRVPRDLDDDGWILVIERAKTRAGDRVLELPPPLRTWLQARAAGLEPDARLFPHRREWVRSQVHQICRAAGVPLVSAQALRGMHGTTSRKAGATPRLVMEALGHDSYSVTQRHYLAPGTEAEVNTQAMWQQLAPAAGFQPGFHAGGAIDIGARLPSVRGAGLEPARREALDPKAPLLDGEALAAGPHHSGPWQPAADPTLAEIERTLVAALDGLRSNFDTSTLRAQLEDALALLRPTAARSGES